MKKRWLGDWELSNTLRLLPSLLLLRSLHTSPGHVYLQLFHLLSVVHEAPSPKVPLKKSKQKSKKGPWMLLCFVFLLCSAAVEVQEASTTLGHESSMKKTRFRRFVLVCEPTTRRGSGRKRTNGRHKHVKESIGKKRGQEDKHAEADRTLVGDRRSVQC